MAQTYTRQSSFIDGDTITAALFNDEYNQLVNAFAYSSTSATNTGHRHDGTAGQGGNIHTIGDLDFLNKIVVDSTNNRWGFYVEVSSAAVEQIRIQDGAIVPVTDSDIDLGTTSLRFKDTFTDSITTTGNVDVGGNLTVTGTTTFNGGTITMGDAADDNVVFGADVNSNIIPNTDNTYDLGSSSQEWKDLYVDGVAYLDSINFNGTAITSTAAELNILDGVTSTAAELNILDGVTSTTAELNILDGVTATATELNLLDGVTSTTAELNILDGVTSTAAELNILDGVTSTTAELNILDGVTSTTAELNILDGVTATAAELNLLDGVTATTAELNILDGVTASATDINLIDGITNGTVIASKAIITDANKDISGGRNITITGELDAATLDISGDADIDGTLEADAITIGGVTLAETISDTVGAMVTSNTETGIAVTYDDSDNTLDFVIGTLNQDTTGNAATATALETARTIHGVSFDGTANIDLSEVIQDTVGAMVSSNTESGITVAYQDADGTLDFTVGTLNQDTTGNAATATALETARTINGVSFDGTANITTLTAGTGVSVSGTEASIGQAVGTSDSPTFADLSLTTLGITNTTTNDSLLITTTEDSSTAAPVITLKRNSGSPADGDYLGQLKFKGENDADQEVVYAKITGKISDASDTTEDGLIEFALRKAGSNNIGARLTSTELKLLNGTGLDVAGDVTIDTNTLVVDTSNNRIGILNASPDVSLDVGSATDAIHVPVGSTAQRPTGANGYFRYNSDDAQFEGYANGAWGAIAGSGGGSSSAFAKNTFAGDGSTTAFTLSTSMTSEDGLIVFIDGVYQADNVYSVSGTTLTFATAPVNGRVIEVFQLEGGIVGVAPVIATMTGDGSDTTLDLTTSPDSENQTFVTIDGVVQHKDTYSISGSTLTFSAAPPNGTKVEAITFNNVSVATFQDADGDTKIQLEESTDEDKIRFDTGGTERVIIDNSGNVGIGTSSPASVLHIYDGGSNTANTITFGNPAVTAKGEIHYNAGGSEFLYISAKGTTSGYGNIVFKTGSTPDERMRIDSNGNLAIGTTTSNGKINIHYSSVFGQLLRYTGSASTVYPIIFEYGGSTVGSISHTSSATSYNTTSDYRLKENVDYNFDALARVKQLKPARFNFIADADTTVDGFIAHEVSDIVPEAITGEKDGEQMQGIDQSKLVPLLTKAIQEQQEQIEALQSEINTLKGGE